MQVTVDELRKKACEVFDLVPDEVAVVFECLFLWILLHVSVLLTHYGCYWQVCIWDYYGRTKHALMDNLEKTLDDANIQMDQDVRTGLYIIVGSRELF